MHLEAQLFIVKKMKRQTFIDQLAKLETCLEVMGDGVFQSSLDEAIDCLTITLAKCKPVLVCGNGGSAADAQHIAGELVGRFLRERQALNVRALSTDTSIITAWANDVSYDSVFSRQVEAYGDSDGILWAISTSGNSKNVILAAKYAKKIGMKVLGLTGHNGGELSNFADILIAVPSNNTPRIQEMHMMIYHYLCEQVEEKF
jgi:D-sedoheptulose 7-phosphate isomerase